MGTREVPRVSVISRHSADCKQAGKGRRYVRCDCPKALYWTIGEKENIEAAGTRLYQVAERRAFEKETQFRKIADGEAPATGKPVAEAVDEYLQTKKDIGLSESALGNYTRLFASFKSYAAVNAIEFLADLKVTHLEKWRSSWTWAKSTAKLHQHYLSSFLAWAQARDYCPTNEAKKLERIKDGGIEQKRALSDPQFQIVLEAAAFLKINHGKTHAQLRALLLLQRWTGLAIQDAVTLPRQTIRRDDSGFYRVSLRREKTGVDVYATIPPAVGDEIAAVSNPDNAHFLFWDGKGTKRNAAKVWAQVYARLAKLEAVAGLKDERGEPLPFTSHILRHTFAAYLFLQGMDITDVAKLMGHSNTKITEAHYSGWIAARQERLADRMREAYRRWEAEQLAMHAKKLDRELVSLATGARIQ